jgi:hypothetical protein
MPEYLFSVGLVYAVPPEPLVFYIVRLCLIVYLISEFIILTYKYYYTWLLY